ncbi:hypothetical protein ABZ383_04420 [Streptomyces sp. NPDC005900]|uniref:hypothetical protein n=1 Tax=Streptomyces sp. NPDC005900 TaxID=3154569 RepID=UPI0033FD57BE
MIHISESLVLQSVEGFLTREELASLSKIMDADPHLADWSPRFQAEAVAVPPQAEEILQHATARAMPTLRRAIPSLRSAAPWGYTELTAGRCVPTHVDGIPDPEAEHCRLGRIGVVLEEADSGGEFYVETTADDSVWSGQVVGEKENFLPGTPLTRSMPHASGPASGPHHGVPGWLADADRTRWVTDVGAGVALAYGAQVIHGVRPVRGGRLRKFVTDLLT